MAIEKYLTRIERIHACITRKATGRPDAFAVKYGAESKYADELPV